jgi:phosphatidylserine/phosphatidylglycerophosphate/cardiolipin synthase-like enzyme
MPDPIKRPEKVCIDEVSCKATSTLQWFLEKRNLKGKGTHPITYNNDIHVFICGQDSFADIASEINRAEQSIDICCWGFDPGMELVRSENKSTWPRGPTYGDLLIAAGKRFNQVRLLVFYDDLAVWPFNPKNMPGYTHDKADIGAVNASDADRLSADNSVKMALASRRPFMPNRSGRSIGESDSDVLWRARQEYCTTWWRAAFQGLLSFVSVRTRAGDPTKINVSLDAEENRPAELSQGELERAGMERLGTHHQKTLLIDYDYEGGKKAVGYVKGLNSVTDYWDTVHHRIDDPMREQSGYREKNEAVQAVNPDPGFRTFKPYRDYACRIDGGGSLLAIYRNFVKAWNRAEARGGSGFDACGPGEDCAAIPSALLRQPRPGHSTVQIVRTQPEEEMDKTIKELYFQVTDVATNGAGYLYVENQYFQYEAWAKRLLEARKLVMADWKEGAKEVGKKKDQMPILHVFIVIPVPELSQMIPRTHDTLATLGQHGGMTGQNDLIEAENNRRVFTRDDLGKPTGGVPKVPKKSGVVDHANSIVKADVGTLEKYRMKIAVAMLQTCGIDQRRMRYREIYIHSKLLIVDDSFFTLGSANLNQRSMAADSEINLATNDPVKAKDLRRRVWSQLTAHAEMDGRDGSPVQIANLHRKWMGLMDKNKTAKLNSRAMSGFLLPLEDNRSSTIRLG